MRSPTSRRSTATSKGYFLVPNDLKSATDSTLVAVAAIEAAGVKNLGQSSLSLISSRPAFTPAVQAIKDTGANYVFARLPFPPLRQEAKVQGATGVKVWDCELPCYDPKVIKEGGPDIEGQYVRLPFLPFDETKQNKMLANFIKYTGPGAHRRLRAQAFAATLAFRQAAEAAIKKSGNNGLTRAAVLEALQHVNNFDADGMIAPVDVGARRIRGCGVVMQIKNQKFVRVDPKKPGTFSCAASNVKVVDLDLLR